MFMSNFCLPSKECVKFIYMLVANRVKFFHTIKRVVALLATVNRLKLVQKCLFLNVCLKIIIITERISISLLFYFIEMLFVRSMFAVLIFGNPP